MVQIDGKKFIASWDARRNKALSYDAIRFLFSIQHSHIRLQDPTQYRDVGFVMFQFENSRRSSQLRRVVPRFDAMMKLWNDEEIGKMIDGVYHIIDEIVIRRAA